MSLLQIAKGHNERQRVEQTKCTKCYFLTAGIILLKWTSEMPSEFCVGMFS